MASRPRRSAAQRATVAITDMADRDRDQGRDISEQRTMSSRSRRSGGFASVSRGPPSSSPASSSTADPNQHIHLTVKLPSSKLRQATSSGTSGTKRKSPDSSAAGKSRGSNAAAAAGKRVRGGKKSYVIESSEDEEDEEDEEEEVEEEEEGEDEIEVGTRAGFANVDDEDEEDDEDEQMEDMGEDAEGDDDADEMDLDAEGDDDEDADGDVDMDTPAPRPPAIKISRSTATPTKLKSLPATKPNGKNAAQYGQDDDDEDEELSELDSDLEEVNDAVRVANGEEDAEGDEDEGEDVDAEGEEEIEVADEDAEVAEEELDSDDEGTGTPDLSKLTARQRAKLGDASHEYLKLSDEVQAKKHFTAEELSMRRAEMARRRRNLSDKRNEEVKMETINKLLKKQAPKTTRKAALAAAGGDETPDVDANRADPVLIRWVSSKEGSRVAVPDELLAGPAGKVFLGGTGIAGGKMVEEVS